MMTMLVKIQDYRPQTQNQNHPPKTPKKCQVALINPAPVILVSCTFAVVAVPCVPSLSLRRCRCAFFPGYL